MKVIILAGGKGTRLAEETSTQPKPMVEIGGKPLLWHVMNIYASYGYKDFLVACGYRGEVIKEYFHNFFFRSSDYVVNLKDGSLQVIHDNGLDWQIGVIDTGLETMTGGRILRLKKWIGEGTFMVTYGDGVANVDLQALVAFHHRHGRLATVTAVRPPARFGSLILEGDVVCQFSEKPQTGEGWINGGFFVFDPGIFRYLRDDQSILERDTLEQVADAGQLIAYRHTDFWHPMDTLRDKQFLELLWASGRPPWKVWD